MKSPTLLWNNTLIKHFTIQTFWITVLYTVMSLIILPFSLSITSFNMAEAAEFNREEILNTLAWLHLALGMFYAVILGLFSVNYKNKENVSDFIHSLPVKRVTVLTNVYIVGSLSIVISTVFIAIILMFQRYILFFEISISDILVWLIYSVTVMMVMFIFAVFAGFFTNRLFIHLQLIVIMFFLPLALWTAILSTANMMFDGISGFQELFESPLVNNTFPVFAVSQIFGLFSWLKTAAWIGAALVGVLFSYILYSKRKNERVNSNFTYYSVRMILSVLIIILGMLVFGNLMGLILSDNSIIRGVAFLLGWIASYIIVEMLFQSTVKIQLTMKTFIISIVSAVVFMIVFYSGWTMYSNHIPKADDVESARVSTGYLYEYDENGIVMDDDFMMVDDEEYIGDVLKAHQFAVDNKVSRDGANVTNKFEVIYKMGGGDEIHRTFHHFPSSDEGYDILHDLRTFPKVRSQDVVYNIAYAENIHRLSLRYYSENTIYIDDESEIENFVEDYKNELENSMNDNPELAQLESDQPFSAEIEFSNDQYDETVEGNSILYNPAVISKVSEEMNLSEFISLNRAENIYAYEITDEDSNFYEDFKYSSFDEFQDKYEIEELDGGERTDVMEEIDAGNISAHSDRVIIYENPDYSEHYTHYEFEVPEWLEDTHFIIGVE